MRKCTHLDQVRDVKPHNRGCEECLQTGDRWLHLRVNWFDSKFHDVTRWLRRLETAVSDEREPSKQALRDGQMLSLRVPAASDSSLLPWSLRLISEIEAADRRAESVAKGLNPLQLNWQPRQGAWSVGQCLEHLRIANEVYLPAISAALEGRQPKTVDDISLSWLSRSFVRTYIGPNPAGTRARAPKKIEPTTQIEASVLEAFLRSNQAARELVRRASDYDVNRIRFQNPFIPLLRFTVGTGLEIIVKHQSRHLLQAEGVRQSAGSYRKLDLGKKR